MTALEKILAGLATLKFALGMVPVSHKKADRIVAKAGEKITQAATVAAQAGAVLTGGGQVPVEPKPRKRAIQNQGSVRAAAGSGPPTRISAVRAGQS